jgi:hypothetical protein
VGTLALNNVIEALKRGLREKLVAVVAYGPEIHPELLVIAQDLPERGFGRQLLLKPMLSPDVTFVLARTPAEFDAHVSALMLEIALDGRILHDPTGYASTRLAALRQRLDESGLFREITPLGEVWAWREPPAGMWTLSGEGPAWGARQEVDYEFRLAAGYLAEAAQDRELIRWRACLENSGRAVEHAARAALATLGPIGRGVQAAALLRQALANGRFGPDAGAPVMRLAEWTELLGDEIRRDAAEGDATDILTPWELFGEAESEMALGVARMAIGVVGRMVQKLPDEG